MVLRRLRPSREPGNPRYDSLSPQERRILGLVADGLTNRQIGAEMFLAEKTVKNYVSSPAAQAARPPDGGGGVGDGAAPGAAR